MIRSLIIDFIAFIKSRNKHPEPCPRCGLGEPEPQSGVEKYEKFGVDIYHWDDSVDSTPWRGKCFHPRQAFRLKLLSIEQVLKIPGIDVLQFPKAQEFAEDNVRFFPMPLPEEEQQLLNPLPMRYG